MNRITVILAMCLLLASSGCASRGAYDALQERTAAAERRISELEGEIGRISDTASASVRRAEAAEAEARKAAASADEAARKADAIFKTSVSK